jgi:hypothetical protein
MWRATSYRAHSQFAWKSSVPPGDALSRSEMSGFYCGERPQLLTASDLRSRPNIAASIRGWARIVALLPRIVVALSAHKLSVPLRSRTPTV